MPYVLNLKIDGYRSLLNYGLSESNHAPLSYRYDQRSRKTRTSPPPNDTA